MGQLARIYYFPVFDLVIFLLSLLSLSFVYFVTSINLWIIVLISTFAYLITLAKSCIITIENDHLWIKFLNPFFKVHSIDIKSIIKINSSESLEFDTVVTAEGYSVLNREYKLEYFDKNGKVEQVTFSIYNKNKEKKILEALKETS